jgi:hypothetical protein
MRSESRSEPQTSQRERSRPGLTTIWRQLSVSPCCSIRAVNEFAISRAASRNQTDARWTRTSAVVIAPASVLEHPRLLVLVQRRVIIGVRDSSERSSKVINTDLLKLSITEEIFSRRNKPVELSLGESILAASGQKSHAEFASPLRYASE